MVKMVNQLRHMANGKNVKTGRSEIDTNGGMAKLASDKMVEMVKWLNW